MFNLTDPFGMNGLTNYLQQQQAQSAADNAKPVRPEWESLLGADGQLGSQYQAGNNLNTSFLDQMREDGLRKPGEQSTWRGLMEQQIQGRAGQAAAGAQAQTQNAMSNMAMQGGLRGGAAERMASSGAMNAAKAKQGVLGQRLQLDIQDETMRGQQLANLGNAEMGAAQYQTGLDQYNIGNTLNENNAQRQADQNFYNQDMQAWAAKQTAAATPTQDSGGCCFIFLEARYGDGTMDSVVRRFRNENMTDKNKRGYYKMSEVLVPLMRKSKLFKGIVRTFMTDPMVSYGKYVYGKGKVGRLFKPLAKFWLKTFDYLGDDHEFVRENGEVV